MADAAKIAQVLTQRSGAPILVERVTALSGGAASATFAVDAARAGVAWPLILQTSASDTPRDAASDAAGASVIGMSKHTQAQLQMVAYAHGLPVAEVIAQLEPGDGLGDGFLMARIDGESLAPRYLRLPDYAAARAALTGQCAAALAALHAIALAAFDGIALPGGSAHAQHGRMFASYRSFGIDSPAFDLAFAWLAERLPDRPASVLVHGDFRSGNFIVGPAGLRAVLDWELAHFGDPLEDLGWLCVNAWRFGNWQAPVGGFGAREDLYAAYEAAGGVPVDRAMAHVWEVYGTLRWGMSCVQLVDDHLSGRVPSVERAAIGRRISEVELDLLHLLKFGSI